MRGVLRFRMTLLVTLALVGASGSGRAQVVEVPTFSVAGPTFAKLLQDVDVAPTPDGGFIIIWGDYSQSRNDALNHAGTRRFSAAGVPLGPPVQVDTSGHVFNPVIAPDPTNGGYIAGWEWIGGGDYLFFAQRLDASGAPLGSDFENTLNLAGFPLPPSEGVVGTASGPMLLWSEAGFWARGIDANKDRRGGDIRVGEGGYEADVAPTRDGGFVAVWSGGVGEQPFMGRVFGPNGEPSGPAFTVSSVFGNGRVAASPSGGFAVAGGRWNADATAVDVWARRFADDGTPLGDEFLVNAGDSGINSEPDVEFDALGNLYVAWTEYRTDNSGAPQRPPRARAFDRAGNPLGPAVPIGSGAAAEIRVARLADGRLVNVWYWSSQASASIVHLCTPGTAACGDGVFEPRCEQCDDGAANSDTTPDACRTNCRAPRCGDGVVDSGEECDDGNTQSCDGCSADCRREPGFRCGDGVRQRECGEQCDDGAANSDSAPGACRTTCVLPSCGDGVVDAGEECDDGNRVSCDGCSFDCKLEAKLPDACEACQPFAPRGAAATCAAVPLPGLTPEQLVRFRAGEREFLEEENVATGLGPVFNGRSCAECHNAPAIGGSSPRLATLIGRMNGGVFDPLVNLGGPVIQEHGITTAQCSVAGEVVPPEATAVARHNAPPLFGAGLLEAIPDLVIRLRADWNDKNHDGISGRFNQIDNRVGRFGWKAQTASLQDFADAAYLIELGITTPFSPAEEKPQGKAATCDPAPDPESDGLADSQLAEFIMLLAPPPPGPASGLSRRGRSVFRRLRCDRCHYDRYRTARNFPVRLLRNRRVLAYTDLLLHDMGPGLADGIAQHAATINEFRTPPLWGVRFSAPYLHDGRAATLTDAIAAHGGEAQKARDRFVALSARDQAALVAFLGSL